MRTVGRAFAMVAGALVLVVTSCASNSGGSPSQAAEGDTMTHTLLRLKS